MPTYQYRCKGCGESLEAVQSFADPALTECPTCGGTLRKVFSSVGVVFKGSGFYRTDSRDKPDSADAKPAADKPAAGGSDKPGKKGGDKGGEKTGEQKPAVKSDTAGSGAASSKSTSTAKSSDASPAA